MRERWHERQFFFSIWIDGRTMGPPAIQKSLDQIDAVRENVKKLPQRHRPRAHGRRSPPRTLSRQDRSAHGRRGRHMIGNDIRMVRIFSDLGVRLHDALPLYNDEWADSSTDQPAHNGLTDYGKEIVREMNRQGMLVDISHVSDKTFYDALEISKAPLIASHSSCRALCDHVRDMSDDMIKALAAKCGVIQINYEKSFIDQGYKDAYAKATGGVVELFAQIKKTCGDDESASAVSKPRSSRN